MADGAEDGGTEAQAGSAETYTVEGTVTSPNRVVVGGLYVEIVDKNVERDVVLTHTRTEERGHYQARFSELYEKTQPDLQARVWASDAADAAFLGESDVRYNATNYETLDVELPANSPGLPSEYETLTGTLKEQYEGQLGELEENDTRQDVTYLANKTGWDARAVALAALADQFGEYRAEGEGAEGLHPAFYYALFRAGLPANPNTLYQTDASMVEGIWQQAIEQEVIPKSLEAELPRAVQNFLNLGSARVLDVRVLAGTSTLREMLRLTLGDDEQRLRQFADLYTRERGDLPKFWDEVQEAFGEETAKELRLEGQLGYLTLNNAPLIRSLNEAEAENPLSNTLDLAKRGYFRAEKWGELLDGSVPDQIPGDTPDEKRDNYAELLAAQVRLSFPTTVVAERVRSGELPLTDDADVRDAVHAFLTENREFEIGMHPVERYIARNDLGDYIDAPVKDQIKRIQRLYQITPTDEAMKVLLENNLDSAYQIVGYDEADFVQNFKDDFGGEDNVRQTYAKSQQVHNAVLNIASSYLTARTAPVLGSDPDAPVVDPAPTDRAAEDAAASDVIAYPTLEGLFGSMDYCACEHCRSILSPAAYLVDLLLLIDRPVNERENPQSVLLERRPDIQHLPLTCTNTNTPLPYVDVVNETLEYFVANNLSLADYTGHDTDDSASAEELLASPQFVNDAAYGTLKTELFPPPMPFHRPLETMRRYFDRFEVPLQEAMEVLRTDDAIERPNDAAYGWRDILMEQLKLSRAEYRLLTDRTITLQQLYGYADGTPNADVLTGLSNVKAFARRVGVSYEDVIELLKTKFINPNSILIPRLERLGVPLSTLKNLKDGTISDAEFDELLPAGLDPAEYGGNIKAWVKNDANYARIMGLITLANPDNEVDLCSFDELEFRYADPDNNANSLRAIEFVRLIRFIRLWKRLGWTTEQTDKAITALYPAAALPTGGGQAADLQRLDTGFRDLLPRLGIAVQVMNRLALTPTKDLLGLLACWSPIDTHGPNSLYRKMLLGSTLLMQDAAFADDGYGNFLQDNNQKVLAHIETLRAAFNLTAEEFTLIVTELGFDANTPLTLDHISAVYRRGWLARELRLSVREFLLLTRFTDFDPFVPPDPPNPPIVRLLDVVGALRAVSMSPAQALYLIWNQDISGQSAPDDRQTTDLARTLRTDLTDIESQFTLAEDPSGDLARARMALVYDSDATDYFFGLLNGTLSVDVPYSHPEHTLGQQIVDAAAGRIAYDDLRKRLSYSGVLSETVRDTLQGVAGVGQEFFAAVDDLYEANQAAIGPFFARYPELQPLFSAYVASADPPEKKRMALLANFLPGLKVSRKRQQALAATSAAAGTDTTFAQVILDDATVLHAVEDNTQPALHDFTALETPGLSAQFFWSDAAGGDVDSAADVVPTLDYSRSGDNNLPENQDSPGDPISGIWSGYLDVPENGSYSISIETDPQAEITLHLGAGEIELDTVLDGENSRTWATLEPVELTAGVLKAVELKVETVKDMLKVRWEATGHGWEGIPARHLYSATLVDHLRITYLRFLKASSLATGLELRADEIAHFAAHADYEIGGRGGWLNALPVSGAPDNPTSRALHKVFAALLDFARIKAALSPDDERLLMLLEDPAATLPSGGSLLLTLTRWERSSLNTLLDRFGKNEADLAHLDTFRLVYDAYALVTRLGISASALIRAATNEPDADTVRDLQSALRARYDEDGWLVVLKSINDVLRNLQRDALVTYVLQKLRENAATSDIDTADKLFEYFLMDVQMEPCMQTSRIRHALSSVQLFIERCLMNLEPDVAPSSIKAAHWEWMQRYRVWEANRKVFLWPENWLEPELRDDQSPFFKETMSELLQSDITEDAAAAALLGYLTKLEEVAKLEPCGIHYEENDLGTANDIAHVVARTAGAQRKYYYRRREFGYWMPWEQIRLDIEDNPVVPVVWKGRLLLFWLKILQQPPIEPASQLPSSRDEDFTRLTLNKVISRGDATNDPTRNLKVTPQAVLCWSEYYNGKWQQTMTSNVNNPTLFRRPFDIAGPDAFARQKLVLGATVESDALRVRILGQVGGSSFLFYNTHSLPLREEDKPALPIGNSSSAIRITNPPPSSERFSISYSSLEAGSFTREVLRNEIGRFYRTVEPFTHSYLPDAPQQSLLQNVWEAPFFFEDSRHVFYVTTTEKVERISERAGFGVAVPQRQPWEIPPLVVAKPDEGLEGILNGDGLMAANSGSSIADPFPIERFVTEDVNIRAVIGTSASVRYGDRELAPGGAISSR